MQKYYKNFSCMYIFYVLPLPIFAIFTIFVRFFDQTIIIININRTTMSKKNSNVLAIAIMFFLFAMISFVTGLQNPMGVIVKSPVRCY